MLISKDDKKLFRPGNFPLGVFTGYNSRIEMLRTTITNVITDTGIFRVSNFELKITDSTISRCWGSEYSALIFSIQNDKMIKIQGTTIKETFS